MKRFWIATLGLLALSACASTPSQIQGWDSVKYTMPVAMHMNTLPLQSPGIY